MTIGVIAALHWEAQCLQRAIGTQQHIIYELTGIGPEAAARGADALLRQGAQLLISFGCAAGLDPKLVSGDLLLPRHVVTASGESLDCDTYWLERFSAQSARVCHKPLAETTTVLSSRPAKATLAASAAAAAADMESATVLRVAQAHGKPALALRAVLDSATQTLPAGLLDCCDAYGRTRPLRMTRWLVTKPARLRAVYALAAAQRCARKTLTDMAVQLSRMI